MITDDKDKARIAANVQRMAEANATQAEIEAYIQSEGLKPVALTKEELTRRKRVREAQNKADMASANSPYIETEDVDGNKQLVHDPQDTYADRLSLILQRGLANVPLGRTASTAASYLAKKAAGDNPTWQEASEENARDIKAAEDLPGNKGVDIPRAIPLIGGSRITAADALAGGASFTKFLKMLPEMGARAAGLSLPAASAVFSAANRVTAPEVAYEGPWETTKGTTKAAATGYLVPKLVGEVMQVPRMVGAKLASRGAQDIDANLVQRNNTQKAMTGPLYDVFEKLGDLPMTQRLQQLLSGDLAQETLARIRKSANGELDNVPDTHPVMLNALYKELGNKAYNADHGITEAAGAARNTLLDAIEESAQMKGGSFSLPVKMFRRMEQAKEALQNAQSVLINAGRTRTPKTKVLEESPAAFIDKYQGEGKNLGAMDRQAATEGILGELQNQPTIERILKIIPAPSRALQAAPDLLSIASEGRISPYGRAANWLSGRGPANTAPTMIASDVSGPNPMASRLRLPSRASSQPESMPMGGPIEPSPTPLLPAQTPVTAADAAFNAPRGLLPSSTNAAYPPYGGQFTEGPSINLGSGAPKQLPATTTPVLDQLMRDQTKGLLPERSSSPVEGTIGKVMRERGGPESGTPEGPAIPSHGLLTDQEIMRRVLQWALFHRGI